MRLRRVFALSACALAGWAARAGDAASDLERLMAARKEVRSSSASFVEHKYLRLLMERLESSGQLSYVAPDLLRKITLKPARETFEIRGEAVTGTQRNGEQYSLSLAEHPEVAALVEGIRATLAGDLPTLQRHYTLDFKREGSQWRLRLTPRERLVREKVDDIVISGEDISPRRVEVLEKDGDRSEMIITPEGT